MAPRVTHMLTLPVLVDLILSSYAQAHNCLEEEVMDDVKRGLVDARLPDPLRAAIWEALKKDHPGMDDNDLIDSLGKSMAKGGRRATPTPDKVLDKMATLFASIDVNVGRANDAIRAMLESPPGRALLQKSLDATGQYLAARLYPVKR